MYTPIEGDSSFHYDASKPKRPRPSTPEQRAKRKMRARMRRAELTPEQRERERSRARERYRNLKRWVREGHVRHCQTEGVLKGSLAHHVLLNLREGPKAAPPLGAFTRFGLPSSICAQIVHLLDRGLIEHDNITHRYNLTSKGGEVLEALDQ